MTEHDEVVRVRTLVIIAFVLQEMVDHFVVLRPDVGVVKVRWRAGGRGLPVAPLVLAGSGHLVWRRVELGGGVWPGGRDLVHLVLVEPIVDVVIIGEYPLRHLAVLLLSRPLRLTTGPHRKIISRWRSWDLGPDGHIFSLTERHKHGVDATPVAG